MQSRVQVVCVLLRSLAAHLFEIENSKHRQGASYNVKFLGSLPRQIFDTLRKAAMRGHVLDIAVSVVVAASFTSVISSLVKDIITPLLGSLGGTIDLSDIFLTLKGPHAHTLADAQRSSALTLNVGVFLNALVNFVIVALSLLLLLRIVKRLTAVDAVPLDTEPARFPPEDIVILREIRDRLAVLDDHLVGGAKANAERSAATRPVADRGLPVGLASDVRNERHRFRLAMDRVQH